MTIKSIDASPVPRPIKPTQKPRRLTMMKRYPCDGPEMLCPFNARSGEDCRTHCGVGVDADSYDETIDDVVEDFECDWSAAAPDLLNMTLEELMFRGY
jgi:hypothetical protein